MFCPKCGKQLNEGTAFCPNCGAKIGALPNDTKSGEMNHSGGAKENQSKAKKSKSWKGSIAAENARTIGLFIMAILAGFGLLVLIVEITSEIDAYKDKEMLNTVKKELAGTTWVADVGELDNEVCVLYIDGSCKYGTLTYKGYESEAIGAYYTAIGNGKVEVTGEYYNNEFVGWIYLTNSDSDFKDNGEIEKMTFHYHYDDESKEFSIERDSKNEMKTKFLSFVYIIGDLDYFNAADEYYWSNYAQIGVNFGHQFYSFDDWLDYLIGHD